MSNVTGNFEFLLYRNLLYYWDPFLSLFQIWKDVVKISCQVLLFKQQIQPGQSLFARANRILADPTSKALQLPRLQREAHTVVIWLQNFQQLAQPSDRHIIGSSCSNKYSPHCVHNIPAIEGVRNYVNEISLLRKLAECASIAIQLLDEQLQLPIWQTLFKVI